jgi:hypothetical protein
LNHQHASLQDTTVEKLCQSIETAQLPIRCTPKDQSYGMLQLLNIGDFNSELNYTVTIKEDTIQFVTTHYESDNPQHQKEMFILMNLLDLERIRNAGLWIVSLLWNSDCMTVSPCCPTVLTETFRQPTGKFKSP